MTPTTLAETILRDVRCAGDDPARQWVWRQDVLAAITAAMDPAIAERAGEVLEGVTPGRWQGEGTVVHVGETLAKYDDGRPRFGGFDLRHSPDAEANARFIAWCREGVPSLIARITAMEAQIKGLEGGIEAACDREAETERKLRTALAASETRAEAAETALVAERAKTAKLVEALKVARAHVANNADGWSVSRGAARVDLTIVDAAITEASQ